MIFFLNIPSLIVDSPFFIIGPFTSRETHFQGTRVALIQHLIHLHRCHGSSLVSLLLHSSGYHRVWIVVGLEEGGVIETFLSMRTHKFFALKTRKSECGRSPVVAHCLFHHSSHMLHMLHTFSCITIRPVQHCNLVFVYNGHLFRTVVPAYWLDFYSCSWSNSSVLTI